MVTSKTYIIAKLKRDFPKIAKELEDGNTSKQTHSITQH